jgi:hypothetical protein
MNDIAFAIPFHARSIIAPRDIVINFSWSLTIDSYHSVALRAELTTKYGGRSLLQRISFTELECEKSYV